MDHDFWHQRWQSGRIGFHESAANPLLVSHLPALALDQGARVFVPLCGKTLDIGWLISKGYRVAGAELSELAIVQLFEELGLDPAVSASGPLKHYQARDIDIFVGDIFELSGPTLGPVDAVFDRAALVALPDRMRSAYAQHIGDITQNAPQLLVTFEYDQSQLDGPPFSVTGDEVKRLYGGRHEISELSRNDLPGGFKGVDTKEVVWLLR